MNPTNSDVFAGYALKLLLALAPLAFIAPPVHNTLFGYLPDPAIFFWVLLPLPFLVLAVLLHHRQPGNVFLIIAIATALVSTFVLIGLGIGYEILRLEPLWQGTAGIKRFAAIGSANQNLVFGIAAALILSAGLARLFLNDFQGFTAGPETGYRRADTSTHGSAEMAELRDIAQRYNSGPLIIGEAYDANHHARKAGTAPFLHWHGNGHIVTLSGPGGAKTGSAAIPNLLTTPFAVVTMDPKGELFAVTARTRAERKRRIYRLNPNNEETDGFNVLDWLDPNSPKIVDQTREVVDLFALNDQTSAHGDDNHFSRDAKDLVATILLDVVCSKDLRPEQKNLLQVRRRLTGEDIRQTLTEITAKGEDYAYGACYQSAMAALNVLETSEKTFGSVYSYAKAMTSFLSSPTVAKMICGDSFRSADILSGDVDIYIQIPEMMLLSKPEGARLILGALINQIYHAEGETKRRVLFLLDEYGALGRMPIVERARDRLRGLGLTIWVMCQNINQLGNRATIAGWEEGASVWQCFGIAGNDTAEYVSARIGTTTVVTQSSSAGSGGSHQMTKWGSKTVSQNSSATSGEAARRVMTPDEIRTMAVDDARVPDEQILFIRNERPIRCGLAKYWRRQELVSLADQNPYETAAARWAAQG